MDWSSKSREDGLEDEAWMFVREKDQREIKGNY